MVYSPSALFTIMKQDHLSSADKIFNPSYRTDSYRKKKIATIGAINCWNKIQIT